MPSYLTLVIRGRFGMFLRWTLTTDKCTLEVYQEFCHDLSFSESERNHNDTPDDGRLTKALWSVTCWCRQRQSETTAGDRETHARPPDEWNRWHCLQGEMPGKEQFMIELKMKEMQLITGLDARTWFIRGRESIWPPCLQRMQRWKRIFTGYADSLQEKK